MTDAYKKTVLRLTTAQICSSIGYNATQTSSIELLQDILNRFLIEFSRDLHRHVEHYNRTEPNMEDLFLTIKNLRINLKSLKEYIENVEQYPFYMTMHSFPKNKTISVHSKEYAVERNNMRPYYVFEYLPPMGDFQYDTNQRKELVSSTDTLKENVKGEINTINNKQNENHLSALSKSFEETTCLNTSLANKGLKSAFMTTTGFISPAVEGRSADMLIPTVFEKWKDLNNQPRNWEEVLYSDIVLGINSLSSTVCSELISNEDYNTISKRTTIANPCLRKESEKLCKGVKKDICKSKSTSKSDDDKQFSNRKNSIDMSSYSTNEVKLQSPIKSQTRKINLLQSEKKMKRQERLKQKLIKKKMKLNYAVPLSKHEVGSECKEDERRYRSILAKELLSHEEIRADNTPLTLNEKNISTGEQVFDDIADPQIMNSGEIPKIINVTPPPISNNTATLLIKDISAVSQKRDSSAASQRDNVAPISNNSSAMKIMNNNAVSKVMNYSTMPQKNNTACSQISNNRAATQIPDSGALTQIFNKSAVAQILDSGTVMQLSDLHGVIQNKIKENPLDSNKISLVLPEKVSKQKKTISLINNKCMDSNTLNPLEHNSGIVLPSGTTITPTAMLIPNVADTDFQPLPSCNVKKFEINEVAFSQSLVPKVDIAKKKRGRKPGSKNSPKTLVSGSLHYNMPMNPLIKELCQSNNCIQTTNFSIESRENSELNIRSEDENSLNVKKKKKLKKTAITKANLVEVKDDKCLIEKAFKKSQILSSLIESDQGIEKKSLSYCPFSNVAGISGPTFVASDSNFKTLGGKNLPLIPLFSFPPAPSLIPSSNLLFPGDFVKRKSVTPDLFTKSNTKDGSSNVISDLHLQQEGSYCNVAPLISDFMSFNKSQNKTDIIECSDTSKRDYGKFGQFVSNSSLIETNQRSRTSFNSLEKCKNKSASVDNNLQCLNQAIIEPIEVSDDSTDGTIRTKVSKGDLPDIDKVSPTNTFNEYQICKLKNDEKYGVESRFPETNSFISKIYESDSCTSFKKLAGGADLIPLSGSNTGLAYSAKSIPPTSLTAIPFNNNDSQKSIPDINAIKADSPNLSFINTSDCDSIKRRESKKNKKLKEGKTKKRKEKKDKVKCKENSETDYEKNMKKRKREKKKIKLQSRDCGLDAPKIIDITTPIQDVNLANVGMYGETVPTIEGNDRPQFSDPIISSNSVVKDDKIELQKVKEFRDMSPELVRISPLITRPPKQKLGTSGIQQTTDKFSSEIPPPSPWVSGSTLAASSVLLPQQLLQCTNRAIAKNNGTEMKNVNIDNGAAKNVNIDNGAANGCKSSYVDAEGNTVWICPACGKVDDGSPMIGCDGCDAWYHWTCVGISEAPNDNEDWFCRLCIAGKKGTGSSEKKKKRNKKK